LRITPVAVNPPRAVKEIVKQKIETVPPIYLSLLGHGKPA